MAPSALKQLRFLGSSFDIVSFVGGCDDAPANLVSLRITLVHVEGQTIDPTSDKRYSFIDVLAHHASSSDEEATGASCQVNSMEEQRSLKDIVRLEMFQLQLQIQTEKERHNARMAKLKMEYLAKLRFVEDLDPATANASFASLEAPISRQNNSRKQSERDRASMYPMPQPSPESDATTLIETGDISGVEAPVYATSSDAELKVNTAICHMQSFDEEFRGNTGNKTSSLEDAVQHFAPHYPCESSAYDDHFPNTKNLSKRKRLSGYLSLKKQRLAASATNKHETYDAKNKKLAVESTSQHFELASSPEELRPAGLTRYFRSSDFIQQDHKQEDVKLTSTKRASHSSGQLLKKRPSWMLAGRVFATQGKKVDCTGTVSQILLTDSFRPSSWPRSQRWRKSFGVSVKALTDGFERLGMAKAVHSPDV